MPIKGVESVDNLKPINTCPVTGLPVFQKPEWTDVKSGNSFKQTVYLVGDRILVQQYSGPITLQDSKDSLSLLEEVWGQMIQKEVPIIIILDYSYNKSITKDGRNFHINRMKQYKQVQSLIFFGMERFAKMGVKLGKRISKFPYEIEIVDTNIQGDTFQVRVIPMLLL